MSLIARTSPDDARLLDVLRDWLPTRRWFPAKGQSVELSAVGSFPLAPDVTVLLVRARAGSIDAVLQVPLVLSDGVHDDAIGVLDGRAVLDGAGRPEFLHAWLSVADGPGADVDVSSARVVSGEQSNTSVILPGARPGILKVLRAVAPGENPDVDVPRHLVSVGWKYVPAPLAWLQGQWPGPDGGLVTGYLGVLASFVDAAEDGFELACAYAARGESFASLAADLGTVTATMHDALVTAYGVEVIDQGPQEVARAVAARFSWALSAVPALARFSDGVAAVVEEVRTLATAPPRQRVHGDLHLGQVLRSHDTWFIMDFEGEPLAPLEQRTRPDLALRDLAGLLRSVDYAAAVGGLTGTDAAAWTADARAGLLRGYGGGDQILLRALELDKTLYEAVYESRNRPSWLPIPIAGLERLTG
ncbi:maltokinase N-terminal cap-like domain-containing protein [Cellulomonas sp. Leaf395]|uniref:maltokinase N-terminal cap-like domain-containing protein n=1 Tax=Cellulomonas sp. Leaf395 TaxID=1736362 RepID=UPI0006F38AD6|nr:aminoglycoside phosphotransferase [Cellulomonas sp. Leaf395]KQT01425.1 aminoglycoside phosphotransferase [Cellulomonas sp. Leaf395]